jgi:hypothetical protein
LAYGDERRRATQHEHRGLSDLGRNRSTGGFGNCDDNPASQIASVNRSNDLYAWTGHSNVNLGSTPNGLNQIGNVGASTVTHDSKGNITADWTLRRMVATSDLGET